MLKAVENNRFVSSIFKVSISNIISLVSGILVGFLVPKMMGLEGYANYKIYTLYLTYLALLSLGVGDGLYLSFSGTDKEKLDVSQISYYLHCYYLHLIALVAPSCVFAIFFTAGEYRFISIALALVILPSQITAIHQNLSILTSRFNEYSTRVITKSVLTSLFVIALFIIYRVDGNVIAYRIYIVGVVLIDYILAIWYIITYKEFNSIRIKVAKNYSPKYYQLILIGFPLLLSNMAGTIFLNLDRQFVSVLFKREEYAIYAFAYNMLTLITTLTSAVSIVLFPSLKKQQNIKIQNSLNNHFTLFTMIAPFFLLVYYPLKYIVTKFLPRYILSLGLLRIVLPGVMLSASVSVIFITYYKMSNTIKKYFWNTLIAIVISALLNFAVYKIFGSYEWISRASILSILIWYMLVLKCLIIRYNIYWRKNTVFLICSMTVFYIVTKIANTILSMLACFFLITILSIIFYKRQLFYYYKRYISQLKGQ